MEEKFSIDSVGGKDPSFSLIAENVALKVEDLYKKSSIPSVSYERVLQMINSYHSKHQHLKKSFKRDKEKETFTTKLENFKTEAKTSLWHLYLQMSRL